MLILIVFVVFPIILPVSSVKNLFIFVTVAKSRGKKLGYSSMQRIVTPSILFSSLDDNLIILKLMIY
jgi:hypothetical protein